MVFQKSRVLAQDGELLPKSDILESQLATSLEGKASGHGVTFREWRFEGTPLETRADSESLESDTCPVQHLRIHVDGLDDATERFRD